MSYVNNPTEYTEKEINIEYEITNSISLDLENLTSNYNNLLIQYKQAVLNYVNYLKQETQTPCGSYTSTSTGIDQTCYNQIWTDAKCTATPTAITSSMTLNSIIDNVWNLATQTDYNSRESCYGNSGNPYIILGIGTSGNLWSRQGLDAPWVIVNDNSNGSLTSICTGSDGTTIFASTTSQTIIQKSSWNATTWQSPLSNSCCVISIAQGQNGAMIGVGTQNTLWTMQDLSSNWVHTESPNGEWISSICIGPNGSIYGIGENQIIYSKPSYTTLSTVNWTEISNTCCVIGITIAPDGTFIGIGTNDELYTMPNYTSLSSSSWSGPYNNENSSCCVTDITTVSNPNYIAGNYNTTSSVNYNVNAQPLVTVKNSAYWGTSSISQNSSSSIQDCQASCSNTPGCSGATFTNQNGESLCSLRGGDSNPVVTPNSYAIVPKGKELLMIVENINGQLTNINKQIQKVTTEGQGAYTIESNQRNNQNSNLIKEYTNLIKEREKINKMLNEYSTVDQKVIEGSIQTNSNYSSFLFLLFIVFIISTILCILLYPTSTQQRHQTGGKLGKNVYYFIIFLILAIIKIIYFPRFNFNFFYK